MRWCVSRRGPTHEGGCKGREACQSRLFVEVSREVPRFFAWGAHQEQAPGLTRGPRKDAAKGASALNPSRRREQIAENEDAGGVHAPYRASPRGRLRSSTHDLFP